MEIINISLCDFDETVIVECTDKNGENKTFHVQTVDRVHRSDLGCGVTTDGSCGEVDEEKYPTFDLAEIVWQAERYIQAMTTEEATEYVANYDEFKFYQRTTKYAASCETVYLIITSNKVDVVIINSNFINADSSSYPRKFSDPIRTFNNKEDAINFLGQNCERH